MVAPLSNPPHAAPETPATQWTGRQRLLTALDCGIPDRVPVNTYEMPGRNSKDWYNNQPSYRRLMGFIRDNTDCITNWRPGNAVVSGDPGATHTLCSNFPVPFDRTVEREGAMTRTTEILHTPKGDLRRVFEKDDNVHTTWVVEHLCKCVDDVDKALSIPFEPIRHDASDYPRVLEELGDHGIVIASLADPAYLAADLMSFQDYTLWAFSETEHFAHAVDSLVERVMTNLENELNTCTVDLYRICGPEYMTPPYLPPSFFKRFMVPHVKKMVDIVHAHGSKVRLHCHGKIAQVLDLFFETGCDATDPCEPPPDGDLELREVKRRCLERHVSVWGNIELKVLEHGTTQQVRETVRDIMEQARPDGGFVLLPTAAPINVPLSPRTEANYMTMIETALELGTY